MKIALLAALGATIFFAFLAANFRSQALKARDELAALKGAMEAETARLAANEPQKAIEEDRQKKEKLELLKLRNEVTQLQGQAKMVETLRLQNHNLSTANQQLRNTAAQPKTPAPGNNPGQVYAKENWTFAGYETPETTLVSAIWAMKEGDPKIYFDSLAPDEQERMAKNWEGKDLDAVAAKQKGEVEKITGLQVVDKQQLSEKEVQLSVYIQGVDRMEKVIIKRSDDGWKFGGFIRPPASPEPAAAPAPAQ